MARLNLSNIRKSFGSHEVIHGVDLRIGDGEFVVFVGPSGCGKSTMLRMIAGLEEVSSGTIHLDGRDVTNVPPAQREIAMVFQSYALFPHMTVLENVMFPLGVRKITGQAARTEGLEALKLVRLEELANRRPSQLSGGQQQRVALARAIVFKPDILLLDEPLGALDRKLREDLQVELKQLQRRLGVTTLLVTHDQEEALSLSDRIMVLNHGKMQQVAPPTEAYLQPANRFVAEFLGIANFVAIDGGRTGVVRPERLRLAPLDSGSLNAGSGGPAGRPARIVEAIYLGQMVRYHLMLEGSAASPMVAALPFVGRTWQAGDAVSVSWDAVDIWPVA
jgi:ABC-type Fe3+/spermidine/putrescine transport system ATPase subunit